VHTAHHTPADLMTAAALDTQLRIDSLRAATSAGVRGDVVALVFGEVDVGGVRGFSGGQEGAKRCPNAAAVARSAGDMSWGSSNGLVAIAPP
jgi:hypothetical protein